MVCPCPDSIKDLLLLSHVNSTGRAESCTVEFGGQRNSAPGCKGHGAMAKSVRMAKGLVAGLLLPLYVVISQRVGEGRSCRGGRVRR